MMIPWPSQIDMAKQAYAILREHGLVYLAGEERVGKLLASILVAEMCQNVEEVLVLSTKQSIIDGWLPTLEKYESIRNITATSYHQAKKLKGRKFDLAILDEAHNYISGYPKHSAMWHDIYNLVYGLPIVYSSATPHGEGRQMLYGQFALSKWGPWSQYKDFYDWFREYGIKQIIKVHGREINQYNKVDDERVQKEVEHLFVTKTRAEAGFGQEPEDEIHWIELDQATKDMYNTILDDKYWVFPDGDEIIADTSAAFRSTLHQIEGGGCKIKRIRNNKVVSDPRVLPNDEKIRYIKATWGDKPNVGIMFNYQSEGLKLRAAFKHAEIYQATSYAEGVDLSHLDHLVIYSQDFRTSKHTQRRARQANRARTKQIKVHFLLVHTAISNDVYDAVSLKKVDFVDSLFNRKKL
jgi:hypothetical protein